MRVLAALAPWTIPDSMARCTGELRPFLRIGLATPHEACVNSHAGGESTAARCASSIPGSEFSQEGSRRKKVASLESFGKAANYGSKKFERSVGRASPSPQP